jgi:DNA-binding MarR family transcriptional regulator/N-acetylglutamate synthase-like GNAT family acetyltransferase
MSRGSAEGATMVETDHRITAVRRFNRFYTRQIGLLGGYLGSPFSLTQVRVLYELAHREQPTASELSRDLGVDPGYLSRILTGFRKSGLIERHPSRTDGRQSHLSLSDKGQAAFAPLDARSHDEIGALLANLSADEQDRLVEAMQTIERLLRREPEHQAPYLLRPPHAGDLGWIIHRHGTLYAQEYGWDEEFEALVASIVAKFVTTFDPKRERCWIAERDGKIVGSVFLVRRSKTVAQLRLLLVEPEARGLGIGSRLVEECIRFARERGYRRLMLWTNDVLDAARRIYERAGFHLVKEEAHHSFGHDLVGQNWELKL